jgi:ribosomal protein L31E
MKQRLHLRKENALNERTLCETLRRTFKLETVKIAVALSNRLWKMREWTSWKG